MNYLITLLTLFSLFWLFKEDNSIDPWIESYPQIQDDKSQRQKPTVIVQVLYNPSHNAWIGPDIIYKATAAGPTFGYNLKTNPPIVGSVAIGQPRDGCVSLTNSDETKGKFVLVNRGSCTFGSKALNVEASGGTGIVIIDQTEGSTYETRSISALGGSGVDTQIPVVLIFNTEGSELISVLESNPDIYLYLGLERVEQGTPCGPAPNVTEKNATTQYTVTEQGITAAYVCNDGFLWKDGAVMKQDVCDDGTWVHKYNDTATWEDGCVEVQNDACDLNPCPVGTVCQYSGMSTRCVCPQNLKQPYYDLRSGRIPSLTDNNHSSCELLRNLDPVHKMFIEQAVVATKNCPFTAPVHTTFRFENISNCDLFNKEMTMYTLISSSTADCKSKSISQCKIRQDRSQDQSCDITCPCQELQCEFLLILESSFQVSVCELSVDT